MTLGVATWFENVPMVVADLLLSREDPSNPVEVPTVGRTGVLYPQLYPQGSPLYPSALGQKGTIIADRCALTFAGDYVDGCEVCQDLKKLADVMHPHPGDQEALSTRYTGASYWIGRV